MSSDSPSQAWAEPPDEPADCDLFGWLDSNDPPRCSDCGGSTAATGEVWGNQAEFRCEEPQDGSDGWERDCRPTWHNIRPLSLAEREED